MIERTNKGIARLNEIVRKVKAASGDLKSVTESVIAGDDPDVVKAREAAERAKAKAEETAQRLNALAEEKAKATLAENQNDDEIKELQTEAETIANKTKATRNLLKVEYGPEVLSLLTPVESQRANSAGTGTGPRRLRGFTVTVNGNVSKMKNNANELVSSFSAAAKDVGCDTSVLQDAYYREVGSDDASKFPVGKTVSFTVTHDGKDYAVTATKDESKSDSK
jgi:hypothetical protein